MKKIFSIKKVKEIKQITKNIYQYVEEKETKQLPRCFDFLKRIIINIEADEKDNFVDIEELSYYILEDYKLMFNAHCGIQEYYINSNDRKKQIEYNKYLSEMIYKLINVIEGD